MLTSPDEEPPRRLAHSVYRRLEDMIFSGQLRGGDVITERQLAEELKVSRTPLRDALLMLESEGLLERRGSRFLEVHRLSVQEFLHNLNVRRLLEPEAARLAVSRIDKKVLEQIEKRLTRLINLSLKDKPIDTEELRQVDDDLHEMIADAADNPLLASLIRDLRRRTRIFDLKRMPERFEVTCREHLDIVGAIGSGDPEAASAAMIQHIDNVKAGIVRRIEQM